MSKVVKALDPVRHVKKAAKVGKKVHKEIHKPLKGLEKQIDRVTGIDNFFSLENTLTGGLQHSLKRAKRDFTSLQKTFRPEVPETNISIPSSVQLSSPVGVGRSAATVDTAATAQQRQRSGQATGTRKLRKTLGGTGSSGLRI